MKSITAAHAVTRYSGSISEMLPHFLVIAGVCVVVLAVLVIYTKTRK